jgi:acetyltransferase-like isoleucine patch superfamily enzyme
MRSLLERMVRLRNPTFRFDPDMNTRALLAFAAGQTWSLFRGFKWLLFGRNPRMAMHGARVTWFNTSRIRFGRFLKLGNDVHLSALGREGITIGDHVGIGAFSRVVVSTSMNQIGARIRIGDHVGIGEYAYLGGAGGLEIGNECIIGQYFSCHPENHNHADLSASIRTQGVNRKGIRIGGNCWIGSKVTILDGVTLGSGCVVAAGAVVTKSFPADSVIGGVPAKLLKERR